MRSQVFGEVPHIAESRGIQSLAGGIPQLFPRHLGKLPSIAGKHKLGCCHGRKYIFNFSLLTYKQEPCEDWSTHPEELSAYLLLARHLPAF